MINLKRFVYTDRLVKLKEHVDFDEVITIEDRHVSPQLQLGVFRRAGEKGTKRQYRLFSVVEHIGNQAHRGHYICYTLDSSNKWVKFDDKRVVSVELNYIKNNAQAYMLFYELMQ
jgi:ubiquitin C-terminal hydrolase